MNRKLFMLICLGSILGFRCTVARGKPLCKYLLRQAIFDNNVFKKRTENEIVDALVSYIAFYDQVNTRFHPNTYTSLLRAIVPDQGVTEHFIPMHIEEKVGSLYGSFALALPSAGETVWIRLSADMQIKLIAKLFEAFKQGRYIQTPVPKWAQWKRSLGMKQWLEPKARIDRAVPEYIRFAKDEHHNFGFMPARMLGSATQKRSVGLYAHGNVAFFALLGELGMPETHMKLQMASISGKNGQGHIWVSLKLPEQDDWQTFDVSNISEQKQKLLQVLFPYNFYEERDFFKLNRNSL